MHQVTIKVGVDLKADRTPDQTCQLLAEGVGPFWLARQVARKQIGAAANSEARLVLTKVEADEVGAVGRKGKGQRLVILDAGSVDVEDQDAAHLST